MAIELNTHTGLWHVEKKIYRIYDVTLPVPLGVRQIVVALGFGVPWIWLVHLLRVPFHPPFGYLIYLVPPGLLAWSSGRSMLENKSMLQYVSSQLRFVGEPKQLNRFRKYTEPGMYIVRPEVWHPGKVSEQPQLIDHDSHLALTAAPLATTRAAAAQGT